MAYINSNQKLMVGADPEFLVLDPGSNTLVGADWRFDGSHGNMSRDGGDYNTAEIRPAPGSPRQVTENIGHILRQSMLPGQRYHNYLLISGGGAAYQKATGGHIHFNMHFGSPNLPSGSAEHAADRERIVKTFDSFLGRPLQAMEGGQRYGTGYGALSDIRLKNYGFEYRTPPGWLPDPALTESVLSVAYLLAERMIEDRQFSKLELATSDDFRSLIPVTGPFRRYWETQVENYLDFVFGGFKLDTLDMRERWNAPALIEWKRGSAMISMLGAFQAQIERAKAEAERRRQEEEQRRIERQAQENAARIERERLANERRLREAADRAAVDAAVAARLPLLADENATFAALGTQQPLSSTEKVRTRYFDAKVFIHRRVQLQNSYNAIDAIERQSTSLRVGALRVIEGFGYGWHEYRLCAETRVTRRRSWRRSRSIQPRENTVYLSKDLQPLIRRSRSLPFKIRFVDIQNNAGSVPRTVIFSPGQGWDINSVLSLFRGSAKPRVPQGFYSLETPVANTVAQLAVA